MQDENRRDPETGSVIGNLVGSGDGVHGRVHSSGTTLEVSGEERTATDVNPGARPLGVGFEAVWVYGWFWRDGPTKVLGVLSSTEHHYRIVGGVESGPQVEGSWGLGSVWDPTVGGG